MQFVLAIALIFWGASIIIGTLFGISIPFLRLFFAGILIYWGVKLLTSRTIFDCKTYFSHKTFYTSSGVFAENGALTYNVAFSNQTVDLRNIPLHEKPTTISLKVRFASTTLILNPGISTVIKVGNSAFTNITFPQHTSTLFTQVEPNVYRTHLDIEPAMVINLDAHFCNVNIQA